MLLKTQILMLAVNLIHTTVSPMAQDASYNHCPVRQLSLPLLVKVIQVARLDRFVWIAPLVLITTASHYAH